MATVFNWIFMPIVSNTKYRWFTFMFCSARLMHFPIYVHLNFIRIRDCVRFYLQAVNFWTGHISVSHTYSHRALIIFNSDIHIISNGIFARSHCTKPEEKQSVCTKPKSFWIVITFMHRKKVRHVIRNTRIGVSLISIGQIWYWTYRHAHPHNLSIDLVVRFISRSNFISQFPVSPHSSSSFALVSCWDFHINSKWSY